MPGPKSDKVWADAVRKAVHAYHEIKHEDGSKEKVRNINLLALNLVALARDGDMQAMKEVGDRLDGKPQASVDVTHRRTATDMSDDELIDIIKGRSGNGTADPAGDEKELPQIH